MPSATPRSSPPRVVLGVAGGIAAYKAVELLRLLRERGYHVAAVLTPDATRFVGAVTFSALASEPVRTSLYGDPLTPSPHTYLGQGADLVLVAPATAHLIARYALGLADDLLTATLLATKAPVLLCPAMHTEMWQQPSVQEHLAILRRRGVLVVEPASGALAGGDEGVGRLRAPTEIAALAERIIEGYRGVLTGVSVLISAGGTREAIDPVRMLTNRSSGHQGYALAEVATRLGATVSLVATIERPLSLDVASSVAVTSVESAQELREAMVKLAPENDVVIMAAAVADFTTVVAPEKLKKRDGVPNLALTETTDILAELAERRRDGQLLVGFAAETQHVLDNARRKLDEKNLDLVVVNDVAAPGTGFEHPTNAVTLLSRTGVDDVVSLRSKEEVAYAVLSKVAALLSQGAP